jgi:hypothetical protein
MVITPGGKGISAALTLTLSDTSIFFVVAVAFVFLAGSYLTMPALSIALRSCERTSGARAMSEASSGDSTRADDATGRTVFFFRLFFHPIFFANTPACRDKAENAFLNSRPVSDIRGRT